MHDLLCLAVDYFQNFVVVIPHIYLSNCFNFGTRKWSKSSYHLFRRHYWYMPRLVVAS